MKIKYKHFMGGETELSITEAIVSAATPSAYSYEGQLDKLAQENDKLRDIVARLVTVIVNGVASKKEAI